MDFWMSITVEKAVDFVSSKFANKFKKFKGKRDDTILKKDICRNLIDRYGNEPFYHDLDLYLDRNKTVGMLIRDFRKSSSRPDIGLEQFVDKNSAAFLEEHLAYRAYSARIKDAFSYIWNSAWAKVMAIDPYSDSGRIQREILTGNAELINKLEDIQNSISYSNHTSDFVPATGEAKEDKPSTRDSEPIQGLFMINRETVTDHQRDADFRGVLSYLRISTNIQDVLYAVCSGMTIECTLNSGSATLVDFIQKEVNEGRQAVFLLGNGGIGKSTALVQTAVRLCDSGKTIYLFQLGSNEDERIVRQVLREIFDRPEQEYILFIDNPFDNSGEVRELLNKIQYMTNVQVVMSERLNRFESIVEDMLPDVYFTSAQMVVPILGKETVHIKNVDGKQISSLWISNEWKREVVLCMFRSIPDVDMGKIVELLNRTNRMSVIEWYLRTCIEYNKLVDTDEALATRHKVKLDWDEWKNLFPTPQLLFSEDEAKKLRNLFPIIAALDIFKIKASTKLLARESEIDEQRMGSILQSVLHSASIEPATYKRDREYPHVALKHDMISTLYFELEEREPQSVMEHVVDLLGADEEAVVRFEKQIFKRKYIQYEYRDQTPFKINTQRLYTKFAQHPVYYEILKERGRAYSFDVAGVWRQKAAGQESSVSERWRDVLIKYESAEPQIKDKVLMCCLDDCQRRELPIPEILSIDENTEVKLKIACVQNDLQGIAAAWKERLSQLYDGGIGEQQLIFVWRRVVFDYLLYGFCMPEEFISILDYVGYQKIDAAYAALEDYIRRNHLDKQRYYELGIRIYEAIADRQSEDISSRIRLADCYRQKKDFRRAESLYQEVLKSYPDNIAAYNALGMLYSQKLKDEWRELESNVKERERLEEACRIALERAIELAESEEDKGISYGAMGWFLFRTMKKYQESYDAFRAALSHWEQASTHSQMGMLCGYFNKNNPCFSIDEAKHHFERAILLLSSKNLKLLSAYMPYANLYYCMGEYDKAVNLYQKAERLGEEKASRMLQKIQTERETVAKLMDCPHETITTLEDARIQTDKDASVFDNEQQANEIFSLLLSTMANEERTSWDVRAAVGILRNFRNSDSRDRYGIVARRVIQQVELAAIACDIGKMYAEQNFRTQCYFIAKNMKDPI